MAEKIPDSVLRWRAQAHDRAPPRAPEGPQEIAEEVGLVKPMPIPWVFVELGVWYAAEQVPLTLGGWLRPPFLACLRHGGQRFIYEGPYIGPPVEHGFVPVGPQ